MARRKARVMPPPRPAGADLGWGELSSAARAYRVLHGAWAALQLVALGWTWWSVMARRRGRALTLARAFLAVQGIGLVVGRGDCPMTPVQLRLGDETPLFRLFLSPRAAERAVPALAVLAVSGVMGTLLCAPRRRNGLPMALDAAQSADATHRRAPR
jgi:hypothetical protein